MKAFFSEYGFIITSAIVVTLLVALASPVGASVKDSVTGLITKFASTSDSLANTMSNNITTLDNNSTDEKIIYVMLDVPTEPVHQGHVFSLRSEAPFSEFQGVEIDGKIVDSANYTAREGSTIIEFTAAYTETLSVGKHSAKILSANGYAEAEIHIFYPEVDERGDLFVLLGSSTHLASATFTNAQYKEDLNEVAQEAFEILENLNLEDIDPILCGTIVYGGFEYFNEVFDYGDECILDLELNYFNWNPGRTFYVLYFDDVLREWFLLDDSLYSWEDEVLTISTNCSGYFAVVYD